jgi:hypothetical protein
MSSINDSFLVDLQHNGDFSNNEKGDLKTISGKDNLIQAIMNRLVTSQGSIIHRPEYGVGIKSYQGTISSISKQRELALKIKSQLEQDDRIDSVDSMKFVLDSDYRSGTFVIEFKITAVGIGQIEESINPFAE